MGGKGGRSIGEGVPGREAGRVDPVGLFPDCGRLAADAGPVLRHRARPLGMVFGGGRQAGVALHLAAADVLDEAGLEGGDAGRILLLGLLPPALDLRSDRRRGGLVFPLELRRLGIALHREVGERLLRPRLQLDEILLRLRLHLLRLQATANLEPLGRGAEEPPAAEDIAFDRGPQLEGSLGRLFLEATEDRLGRLERQELLCPRDGSLVRSLELDKELIPLRHRAVVCRRRAGLDAALGEELLRFSDRLVELAAPQGVILLGPGEELLRVVALLLEDLLHRALLELAVFADLCRLLVASAIDGCGLRLPLLVDLLLFGRPLRLKATENRVVLLLRRLDLLLVLGRRGGDSPLRFFFRYRNFPIAFRDDLVLQSCPGGRRGAEELHLAAKVIAIVGLDVGGSGGGSGKLVGRHGGSGNQQRKMDRGRKTAGGGAFRGRGLKSAPGTVGGPGTAGGGTRPGDGAVSDLPRRRRPAPPARAPRRAGRWLPRSASHPA